ncbi:MAG: hypothetical protein OXN94_03970 [Chloroflexota bacterium]|nr:hypothetical protein [Chloroflexota bacterium]
MLRTFSALLALCFIALPLAGQSQEAALVLEHSGGVVTASWNPAETQILTAAQSGLAQIWSAEDGALLQSINHEGSPLTQALWSEDGTSILSADESGLVLHSRAEDGERIHAWQVGGMPIQLALDADGRRAFVFTANGQGSILSLIDGGVPATVERSGAIVGAGWGADGSQIRAWSEDGRIVAWDAATGENAATYSLPHRALLQGLQWNNDDSRLLAWFADGTVAAYETDGASVNGRSLAGVRHRSFAQRAIWSADETRVMSWAADDTVHVWSVPDSRSQQVLRHEDWVVGARWDPAEARVLSWSHIYLYLWEGETLQNRFQHGNLVRGAVWNEAATQILSWSWDGTARVWSP